MRVWTKPDPLCVSCFVMSLLDSRFRSVPELIGAFACICSWTGFFAISRMVTGEDIQLINDQLELKKVREERERLIDDLIESEYLEE